MGLTADMCTNWLILTKSPKISKNLQKSPTSNLGSNDKKMHSYQHLHIFLSLTEFNIYTLIEVDMLKIVNVRI